jgi:SHS2 domain-containing protein
MNRDTPRIARTSPDSIERTREWSYFGHDADVGIIGRGPTVEEAFIAAAKAVFALMVDPEQVQLTDSLSFSFEEESAELALVTWLNRLLAEARTENLALAAFRLTRKNGRWQGEAKGEDWREAHDRGVEVKGATLTMLSVKAVDGGWEARCIVDV